MVWERVDDEQNLPTPKANIRPDPFISGRWLAGSLPLMKALLSCCHRRVVREPLGSLPQARHVECMRTCCGRRIDGRCGGTHESREKGGTLPVSYLIHSKLSIPRFIHQIIPKSRKSYVKVQATSTANTRSDYTMERQESPTLSPPPTQEIGPFGNGRISVQRGEEDVIIDLTLGTAPIRELKTGGPVSMNNQARSKK